MKKITFSNLICKLLLLGILLFSNLTFSQIDLGGENLNFRETNRTVLTNAGSSGASQGSVHKYANLVTKGALVIYGKLTIVSMSNGITIPTFDDDTSNPARFQPRLTNPNSNTGFCKQRRICTCRWF